MADDMTYEEVRRDVLTRLQWLANVPANVSEDAAAGQRALAYMQSICASMHALEVRLRRKKQKLDEDRANFEKSRADAWEEIDRQSRELAAREAALQQTAQLNDLAAKMAQMDLKLEKQQGALQKQQGLLENQQGTLQGQHEALQSQQAALEGQQGAVQEGQAGLRRQLQDQSAKISDLQRICAVSQKEEKKLSRLQEVVVRQSEHIEALQTLLSEEETLRRDACASLQHKRRELDRVIRLVQVEESSRGRSIHAGHSSRAALRAARSPSPTWGDEIDRLKSRLQRFRPRVDASSRANSAEILSLFMHACASEAAEQRLERLVAEADIEVWYCLEKVSRLGIDSSESKVRGACQDHARCLQVKRPLITQTGNIVCRFA
ncbi:hypothetical protein DL770_010831 [Monosporascus sp. CRB-9-2]|nr:hypothetical protein DL770_010831 [Monosporascus sp. CRB-9-2]